MKSMIRFKAVVYHSNIVLNGKNRKRLPFSVVSVALIPFQTSRKIRSCKDPIPEIFWQ